MKRACFTFGGILIVLGMALSWLGYQMGGETTASVHLFGRTWSVDAPFSSGGYSYRAFDTPQASLSPGYNEPVFHGAADESGTSFRSIYVDVDLGNVIIARGDDYGVSIDSWGAGYQIDQWNYGGDLVIESSGSALLSGKYGSEITIFVPRDAVLDYLNVELDVGDVALTGLTVQDSYLDLDLGSVVGEALTVRGTLNVDADLGSVALYGSLGESVYICADVGDVTLGLSNPASDYYWSFTTGLGSITVDGRKQGSGNVTISGGRGSNWLSVDADLGAITVDFDQAVPPADVQAIYQGGETTVTWESNAVQGAITQVQDSGIAMETAQ